MGKIILGIIVGVSSVGFGAVSFVVSQSHSNVVPATSNTQAAVLNTTRATNTNTESPNIGRLAAGVVKPTQPKSLNKEKELEGERVVERAMYYGEQNDSAIESEEEFEDD